MCVVLTPFPSVDAPITVLLTDSITADTCVTTHKVRLVARLSDAHTVIFNRKAQFTVLTEGLLQSREICESSVDELYEHWMLGGAIEKDRPPTWSTLRNALGRVE